MTRYVLDRFEGEYAVCCGDSGNIDIERVRLPKGARIGDTLVVDGGKISIDRAETLARRKRIAELAAKLWDD